MFRQLCGESILRNVVIVTNMWGEVDRQVGEAREAELKDTFFKSSLEKGAQIARNENTITSAQKIIRLILNNHPIPLQIRVEPLGEQSRCFEETLAIADTKRLASDYREERVRFESRLAQMEAEARDRRAAV